MGNGRPTRPFCHSSTLEGYICYILQTIFLRGSPHVSWEFIGVSLPRASVRRREVRAWRPVFPIAERVLTSTAAGFVLGHPRRCVMRLWVQNENISPPLWPTLQEPGYRGEGIPENALDALTLRPYDDAPLGNVFKRACLSMTRPEVHDYLLTDPGLWSLVSAPP
jgi:hypothetical protein